MMLQRPAKMINGLLMLSVIGCASIQAQPTTSKLHVEIQPDNQMAVRLGQRQTILCKVAVPLQFCRFEIPGEGSLLQKPNQQYEDLVYFGQGYSKGECGVTIQSVKERHDGNITCFLTPENGRSESSNSIRLIVAREPEEPRLYLNKPYPFKNGEKMEVSCIAEGGKPPANISLFLDNEAIIEEPPFAYGRPIDENLATINTSRSVTPMDHGKTLRCIAKHLALAQPKETTRQIEVIFPPQTQQTIERFGYSIGRPGKVNVTVHANPMPRFFWKIDDEKIEAGKTDGSGRIQTSTAISMGHGLWSVELNIDSVQKSDTDKTYSLEAHNDEGFALYKIILSSSSEPPAGALGSFNQFYGKLSEHMHALGVELDAGSIIGIVVGVLVLILAVFLIVFARATGRWCFAGGSAKRNIGESSDTESTGRYSRTEIGSGKSSGRGRPKINLSQLFKRNKDKVSGADTDTVRTVVTMDDEKIPSSGVTTTAVTPTSGHDAGIVYAELDLAHQKQVAPRRLNEEKTEYAEILYTKPDGQPQEPTADK